MGACNYLVWIWGLGLLWGRKRAGRRSLTTPSNRLYGLLNWYGCLVVGLKHLETSQFLVYERKRLELLGLGHLLFEPRLCLVLLDLFQVGMIIVDVSAAVR